MDEPARNPDHDMIERARRRYGAMGAVVASGMLGIDKILGRKPNEEIPAVWEASGEPGDIDKDGIAIDIDDSTQVRSNPGSPTDPSIARVRSVTRRRLRS